MSIPSDVAGTGEGGRRGRTPKGFFHSGEFLGHGMNNSMTVICFGWGAIGRKNVYREQSLSDIKNL